MGKKLFILGSVYSDCLKTMKLLSFQPCSLYQNGGCGRVLRRLYEVREQDVISIAANSTAFNKSMGAIKEEQIILFPQQQKWMRWRLRSMNSYLQNNLLHNINRKRIHSVIQKYNYNVIHTVNHGAYSASLFVPKLIKGKKLWASFHDHYSLCSSFLDCEMLWETADRRLVISKELGEEYARLFSQKPFEIITDGLLENEIASPKQITGQPIVIYFGGLLHYDYLPLFRVLADVLDTMILKQGFAFKFIIRGAANIGFLNDRLFEVEYRNSFISDEAIGKELNEAAILYLPIKFNNPAFYLYSLSTKMIGYLGAAGKILYHGPTDSAAYRLLCNSSAAILCTTLDKTDLYKALENALWESDQVSENAKLLAQQQFYLNRIQNEFWK